MLPTVNWNEFEPPDAVNNPNEPTTDPTCENSIHKYVKIVQKAKKIIGQIKKPKKFIDLATPRNKSLSELLKHFVLPTQKFA